MKRILGSLIVGGLALMLVIASGSPHRVRAQESAGRHVWKTYTNVRFQYSICYPEDLLAPQGEADNSDGQKFTGKDGAKLTVYGRNNALNQSLADMLDQTSARLAGKSGKVRYKAIRPKWFVVSGVNSPSIFYAKMFLSQHQFKSFELTYSESEAALYKRVMARLAACFADLAR